MLKIKNPIKSFFNTIKNLIFFLDQKDKRKSLFLVIMILINSLLEVLSLGVIFPTIQFIFNQDTINKYFREYLVNFSYFAQVMEDYGFVILDAEEAQSKNLPNGTGLFSELHQNIDDSYGLAHKMTENEKQISFLNRYFVFKKMRDVDAGIIYKNAISNKEFEVIKIKDAKEDIKESETESKK